MAAATSSRVGADIVRTEPRGFDVAVGLETGISLVPAGTLVGVTAAGFGEIAVANVAYPIVGVALDEYDTSSDSANGDTVANIRCGGVVKLVTSGLTITNVGDDVYIVDNQTVTTTDPADATPAIGFITEFVSATASYVKLYDKAVQVA